MIKKLLLSKSFQIINLSLIFEKLKPQQCLVNILFDEVKSIQTMRFTGGHVLGYANDTSEDLADNSSMELASHALVIEITCHFGGPRYF